MGKEIIQIHLGQSGVQIANACWELYCLEHGIRPDGYMGLEDDAAAGQENSAEPFFAAPGGGKMVPRVVMVDLEPTVIDEIRSGAYRELFHPNSLLTGKEDAASNFARGMFSIGREMLDIALDRVRVVAEGCSSLQGFIVYRAYGGGTGSGFTPILLDGLNRDYGKVTKIDLGIYPAPKISPIIVEPYNAVLTTHSCMDVSDVSFVIDNEALYDILARSLDVPRPTYTNLNRIIAQVVSCMTASMRFEGDSNMQLVEFKTNLIPFPRIHFPLVTYAPLVPAARALHESLNCNQLALSTFEPANQMVKCDTRQGCYMTCIFLFRGDVNASEINTVINQIKQMKSIKFVSWAPGGFKVSTNYQPPATVLRGDLAATNRACVMVANTSAIRFPFETLVRKFSLLYSKRAFIHHYVGEGLEEGEFTNALNNVKALINDYQELENDSAGGAAESGAAGGSGADDDDEL